MRVGTMPARMSRKYKVITARPEHDAAKSALMNRDIEDYGCRRARGGGISGRNSS